LTPEAVTFFSRVTRGRSRGEIIFGRLNKDRASVPWQNRPAQRLLKTACKNAEIQPPVTFHELRHTAASTWIRQGVRLQIVSEQLGHSDISITVRHYAHIAPDWKAEVFDSLPPLGFSSAANRPAARRKPVIQ
jgi:integrase